MPVQSFHRDLVSQLCWQMCFDPNRIQILNFNKRLISNNRFPKVPTQETSRPSISALIGRKSMIFFSLTIDSISLAFRPNDDS